MARVTAQETADRVELVAGMFFVGSSNTECLVNARQTWGGLQGTGLQAREAGLGSDKDDIDKAGIDRQDLLSWAIQTLITASGQAMKQKNSGAAVSCISQVDHMTGTGYNSHRCHGVRR